MRTPEDLLGEIFGVRDAASASADAAARDADTAGDAAGRAESAAASAETDAAAAAASAEESAHWAGIANQGYGPASEEEPGITRYGTLEEHRSGVSGVVAQPAHVRTLLEEAAARLPAPAMGDLGKVLTVDGNGEYVLGFGGGLPGLVSPYAGSMGGPDDKHPVNRRTGQPDLRYALCDGGTYTAPDGVEATTPDLRDRFILAAGDAHPAEETGGSETLEVTVTVDPVTLSVAQMPSHAHEARTFIDAQGNPLATNFDVSRSLVLTQSGGSVQPAGGNGSHTHTASAGSTTASSMPPYYTLAFIMEL